MSLFFSKKDLLNPNNTAIKLILNYLPFINKAIAKYERRTYYF